MAARDPEATLIPLTRGQFAIVDQHDAHLSGWKWFVLKPAKSGFTYAVRTMDYQGHRKTIYMHHFIIGCPLNRRLVVDHVNGNRLDNRRSNLRVVTQRQNTSNGPKHRDGKSVGVSWHKRNNKWIAHIFVDGKLRHLGYFKNIESGHNAYLAALARLPAGVL